MDTPNLDAEKVSEQTIKDAETETDVEQSVTAANTDYSVWSVNAKKAMILAASTAAFFSPLSSNIYFPALTTIANALHVSNGKINLTVTTYMIFQAIAPTMIAGFSDNAGRRPAYMLCAVIYIIANIALALQNNYTALLVLRMVQSAGSSGTVALANGVVTDTVTSSERGMYIGYASVGGILGPSISPVIGGLITEYLDWHWIFWFLLIISCVFFIPFLLFLPETCRKVVGNGSIPPPKPSVCITTIVLRRSAKAGFDEAEKLRLRQNYRFRFPNPITTTLAIIFTREGSIILFTNSIVYACFYAITTAIPTMFKEIYGFSALELGFVYLPIAGASLISAFTTGKALDRQYARYARQLGMSPRRNRADNLRDFPIERARLLISLPLLAVASLGIIAYGWVMEAEPRVAWPFVLLFVIAFAIIAAFQTMSILMVDIFPGRAATCSAANNLVRCLLGAAAAAVVDPMMNSIGRGWTYTLFGGIWIIFSPLLLVLLKWGPQWRRQRWDREKM